MKTSSKILLGLATLWPFLYMILFFVFVFSLVLFAPNSEDGGLGVHLGVFMALHILTMLWIMALTIFYMVNVFRNERVEKDKKVLWAVVIFMGSLIAMPVYWYLYIWKNSSAPSLAANPAAGALGPSGLTFDSSSNREDYVPPLQPPNWR